MAPLCYSKADVHRSVGWLPCAIEVGLGVVCQLELLFSGRHHRMAGAEGLFSQWRMLAGGAEEWLPCAIAMRSCTGVENGSLMQSRLGVWYANWSCCFPDGTTEWLELEDSLANGGLLERGAGEWLPCSMAMWRWSCTGV